MGQFGATDRVTATHPNSEQGGWYLLSPTAATITVEFSNETLDVGGNANCLGYLYWSPNADGSGNHQIGSTVGPFGALSSTASFSFSTVGIPSGSYIAAGFGPNTGPDTISMDITLFDDLTYCGYGSKPKSGFPAFLTLAASDILAVLNFVKGNWAVAIVSFMVGQNLDIAGLCAYPRPSEVKFTLQDIKNLDPLFNNGSLEDAFKKVRLWFAYLSWPYFCECVGGSPPPIDHPNPPPPKPPQVDHGPLEAYTCDQQDICSQLKNLTFSIAGLLARINLIESTTSLMQRQGVPFGYIPGTTHGPLTGEGVITVSDTLGLSVFLSSVPPGGGVGIATPMNYYDLGELSLGTDTDGYLTRLRITHNPMLVMPVSAAVTRVGYTLTDGSVAYITELKMEAHP